MRHRALRVASARLAGGALIAIGLTGCLLGTDHEPEEAGIFGADTLGLELVPGWAVDGIDPPAETDTGTGFDPFEGYDCDNADYYDDVCEYHVCQLEDAWAQLLELCADGDIDEEACAQTKACLAAYIDCLENHCDVQTGIDSDDLSLCSAGYQACLD